MLLRLLLPDITGAYLIQGDEQLDITAIAYDSRKVGRGALFVAVPGFETDGHEYLAQALERGAAGLLVQEDRRAAWETALADRAVAVIAVPDTRRALADASAAFYGHPARALRIVAVTGTKGKTTTSYLATALLEAGGQPTGLISSVEFKVGDRFVANSSQTTTPESLEVQSLLAQMRDAGARYAVVEGTSHALALHRLARLEPDVAVFTNLYPDHLDFHPDMEHYRASKARLFAMLDDAAHKGIEKLAVLNADDPASAAMRSSTKKARVLTYGVESPADVRAVDVQLSEKGSRFRLIAPQGEIEAGVPLLGLFSVYNSLGAATVALSQGVSLEQVVEGLAAFRGVPGRLEPVDCGQPFGVVVDFAHTGDSLRSILQALRPVASGRLIAVFGAGGDRDPGRRTGMGAAAAELADFTVLCNDNPRTEDPARILDQIAQSMLAAAAAEGGGFVRIPDRREAMRHAFGLAREGDVVLVAGKGHEPYLIVGTEYLPWDDREVAREELRALQVAR
ncbi:MAG: UDP-N-acetylmuramoyl-L-alanyl-D-glutamate--2,6-diaminopimelate ligase [Dehalococcoidia bacterium]